VLHTTSKRQAITEDNNELEVELHSFEINHLGLYDFSHIERQDRIHQTMQLRVKI
jgi:hypothetical protein